MTLQRNPKCVPAVKQNFLYAGRTDIHTYTQTNKQNTQTQRERERESTVNDLVDKRRSQEGNGSRETGVSGERAYLGDAKQTTEGRRGAKESEDLVMKKSLYLYRGRQMLVAVGFKPRSSKIYGWCYPLHNRRAII